MFLTILTPTYNRANTLPRLYKSLRKQSLKQFEWLIVDDGSTDETKKFVNKIMKDPSIKIRYIYKKNGGKHTAINHGIQHIHTALTFIVDSDDYLTEDAVETIYQKWNFYKNKPDIGSFWFLQSDQDGNVVGDKFPSDVFVSRYTEIMINSGVSGDKKSVYRTKLRKQFPFPVYKGETFIGEGIIHKRIGNYYKSVFINKVIYKSEYLDDGLTKAGRALRVKTPLGGMAISKEFLTKDVHFKIRSKKMILYITYGLLAKIKLKKIIASSEHTLLALSCLPFAYVLYKRWKKKYL
jgi:glycosyltransferase involved in cell wall biosynthesis